MNITREYCKDTQKKDCQKIKDGFTRGVVILTVSNLLVKIIGVLFKIPMNRIIGDMGMGYYNSAYSIYTLFYMLATSGLPVAISVTVSEKRARGKISDAKRVFKFALVVFAVIGLCFSVVMLFSSHGLASLIGSELTALSITVAAPALLFVCISGAYRGYYQGCGNMTPTAISQLIEATGKLIIGITAALYALNKGYSIHIVAAYAVLGLTLGSLFGMMYLLVTGAVRRDCDLLTDIRIDNTHDRISDVATKFIKISLPVTLSSSVMSLTNTLDTAMIQRVLISLGMSCEEAAAVYGNYTSLAVPMFNLPPVLVYPIAYSLVPVVSAAMASGRISEATERITYSLRYAMIIGLPCAMGMSVLSDPILCLFYNEQSANLASFLLTLLAPSSMLICILAVTNSVLQGCGKERMPVYSMLIGGAVKLISGMFLIRNYGINGAPISTFLCYLTVTVLNLAFTVKYTGIHLNGRMWIKPLFSSVLCSFVALLMYRTMLTICGKTVSCIVSIFLAAVTYFFALVLLGELSLKEIKHTICKNEGIYHDNGRKKDKAKKRGAS